MYWTKNILIRQVLDSGTVQNKYTRPEREGKVESQIKLYKAMIVPTGIN
jgi:hypothetical protein